MSFLCTLALLSCLASASARLLLQTSSSGSNSNSFSSSNSSISDSSTSLPSDWTFGHATYYGGAPDGLSPYQPSFGTKDGGCGYGVLSKSVYPYWSVAALSSSNKYYQAGPANGCGECFEVQCLQEGGKYQGNCNGDANQRSVTVMITDGCPECEADHMDMQALTYEKIAPMAGGNIDMRYRRVQCTPASNIIIDIDSNACANGWIRLHVEQVSNRGAIALVQVKGQSSGWEALTNKWGASWELASAPDLPLDLRVQDDDGSEVTAFGAITKDCQTGSVTTGVQFGSPDSAAPSSPSDSGEPEVTAFEGPPNVPSAEGIPRIGGPAGRVDPCVTAFDESTTSCGSPTSPSSSSDSNSTATPSDAADSSNTSSSHPVASRGNSRSPSANHSSPAASTSSPAPHQANSSSPPPAPSSPSSNSSKNSSSAPAPTPAVSSSNQSSPSPLPSPSHASSPSNSSSDSGSNPSSPSSWSSPSSPSSSSDCFDEQTPGYSCSQQQTWGACGTSWMQSSNWCRKTCGYC